jgi:hypothetical protein
MRHRHWMIVHARLPSHSATPTTFDFKSCSPEILLVGSVLGLVPAWADTRCWQWR